MNEFVKFKESGMVFVTDVVFAETSAGMASSSELRRALEEFGIAKLDATDDALYLAGQVYLSYKKAAGEGKKNGVLPDFMIGAVAETSGVALITFNDKDFVNKFQYLEVINPAEK